MKGRVKFYKITETRTIYTVKVAEKGRRISQDTITEEFASVAEAKKAAEKFYGCPIEWEN